MNEVRASVFEAAVDSMDGRSFSMELASLDYGHRVLPPGFPPQARNRSKL